MEGDTMIDEQEARALPKWARKVLAMRLAEMCRLRGTLPDPNDFGLPDPTGALYFGLIYDPCADIAYLVECPCEEMPEPHDHMVIFRDGGPDNERDECAVLKAA
jgi:hypothetical protein